MKIFLIVGKSGSGTMYVSSMIKDVLKERGYNVMRHDMFEDLENICKQYFGWDGNKDKKGRDLLINIGFYCGKGICKLKDGRVYGKDGVDITEFYNKFVELYNPSINIWSDLVIKKIIDKIDVYDVFVVSGVKFFDEILSFKSVFFNNVITIKVLNGENKIYIDDISDNMVDNIKTDYVINNFIDQNEYVIKQIMDIIDVVGVL